MFWMDLIVYLWYLVLCFIFFFVVVDVYIYIDLEFLKFDNIQSKDAGLIVFIVIFVGNRLLVVNVGDFRVVICRGGDGKIFQ